MYIVIQFWLDIARSSIAGVNLAYQSTDFYAAFSAYEECCEIERTAEYRPIPEPYTIISVPSEMGSTIRQMHIISDDGSYVASIGLLKIDTPTKT